MKENKVGKVENILDECSLISKIAIAGLGIVTSTIGLISGVRLLKSKHENPDFYWENKRKCVSEGHKAIAEGLNRIADAMSKDK